MSAPQRRVTLGRVAGVYGIRGWVKLQSYTRPAENLLDYPRWWLATAQPYEARLVQGRQHGQGLVAQLSDATGAPIEDRDLAAALVGVEIQVDRDALPETREPGRGMGQQPAFIALLQP